MRLMKLVGMRVLLALMFAAAACKDDGPTAPLRTPTLLPTSTPTPNPSPTSTPTPNPSMNLSGSWTGTMHDLADDCPGLTVDVAVTITQSGSQIRFSFQSEGGCSSGGITSFTGTLMGSTLTGALQRQVRNSCLLSGSASGPAGPDHIQLDGSMGGACHDVRTHVDLARH